MKILEGQSVFCSFAATGEDEAIYIPRMKRVVSAFEEVGINAYCNLFDPEVKDFKKPNQWIKHALAVLATKDILAVVKTSEKVSEGMSIEVGAALGKKPIILAQHTGTIGKTYLDDLASLTFQWETEDELVSGFKGLV